MRRLITLVGAVGLAALSCNVAQATGAVEYSGRAVVNVFAFTPTPVPSGEQVGCILTLDVADVAGEDHETMYMEATQIASSPTPEYECAFSLPWQWLLETPTTDPITVSATVGYLAAGTTTLTTSLTRYSTHTLAPVAYLAANPSLISAKFLFRL